MNLGECERPPWVINEKRETRCVSNGVQLPDNSGGRERERAVPHFHAHQTKILTSQIELNFNTALTSIDTTKTLDLKLHQKQSLRKLSSLHFVGPYFAPHRSTLGSLWCLSIATFRHVRNLLFDLWCWSKVSRQMKSLHRTHNMQQNHLVLATLFLLVQNDIRIILLSSVVVVMGGGGRRRVRDSIQIAESLSCFYKVQRCIAFMECCRTRGFYYAQPVHNDLSWNTVSESCHFMHSRFSA